ncbi:DNA-directed RNA polymerase III, subunit Rpc31 [Chytridium lagenaria]|nr:DNA-directed RNA polymerase III, subunit Rpc31 [Chytridium lagenaria]
MSRGGRGGGGGWRGGRGGGQRYGPDIPDGVQVSYHDSPIYPALELPPFLKCTAEEKKMLDLDKDFVEKIKESPYHITIIAKKHDIERYADRYIKKPITSAQRATEIPCDNLKFFPEELHYIHDPSKKLGARTVRTEELINKRLKQLEKEEAEGGGKAKENDDDDEVTAGNEYDEEEEEEEDDYQENFYEENDDEGESDDGGGGDY